MNYALRGRTLGGYIYIGSTKRENTQVSTDLPFSRGLGPIDTRMALWSAREASIVTWRIWPDSAMAGVLTGAPVSRNYLDPPPLEVVSYPLKTPAGCESH
eukprot:9272307-Pyramimonas_sp.AAC.1